jgi:threonine/homoserine efflux transporter RhtA
MNAARSWGYRHTYAYTGVRIAAGSWNLLLGIFFLSHGQRWGSVLLAVSALIFWAAYILAPGKAGSRSTRRS